MHMFPVFLCLSNLIGISAGLKWQLYVFVCDYVYVCGHPVLRGTGHSVLYNCLYFYPSLVGWFFFFFWHVTLERLIYNFLIFFHLPVIHIKQASPRMWYIVFSMLIRVFFFKFYFIEFVIFLNLRNLIGNGTLDKVHEDLSHVVHTCNPRAGKVETVASLACAGEPV